MKQKKSQIKLFESIGILIIFFILLVIGFVIYNTLHKSSQERELLKISQNNALKLMQKTLTLPALDCSFAGIQKPNCIDIHKLTASTAINQQPETHLILYQTYSTSRIIVHQIYPEPKEWTLYNNPLTAYRSKEHMQTPIILSDSINSINTFGIIEVDLYAQ